MTHISPFSRANAEIKNIHVEVHKGRHTAQDSQSHSPVAKNTLQKQVTSCEASVQSGIRQLHVVALDP